MQFGPLTQYVCSQCGSVLEIYTGIDISTVKETCPNCNLYLADTLRQNPGIERRKQVPRLQTAFNLSRFRLDVPSIDSRLELTTTGSLCISGYMASEILTRLCIRAIMPANHGGLDSPYAIVVDAGNKSDFYQTVDLARQYGLDIKATLDRIIVSRAFTINQLKNLISKELPKVLIEYQARIVIIPGLLDLFDDPNIKEEEAKRVIASILKSISQLASRLVVGATIAQGRYSDRAMLSFQKRIILTTNHQPNAKICDGRTTETTIAEG